MRVETDFETMLGWTLIVDVRVPSSDHTNLANFIEAAGPPNCLVKLRTVHKAPSPARSAHHGGIFMTGSSRTHPGRAYSLSEVVRFRVELESKQRVLLKLTLGI